MTQRTPISQHTASTYWMLFLLSFFGCAGETTVEVTISGIRSDVPLLQVRAMLNGRASIPAGRSVRSDAPSLIIQLPVNKTGDLVLFVEGLRDVGCVLARGVGRTRVDGPGSYQTTIELHGQPPSCLIPEGRTERFLGVWGSGPSDVWAVGSGGTAWHWEGFTWAAIPTATTQTLSAVWGSAPENFWAVGGDQFGVIQHWNGSAWTSVPTPDVAVLRGVWGSGPSDVWAVGQSILHWDGTAWTSAAAWSTYSRRAVWGSGPDDVWAVGDGGGISRWNGSAWSYSSSGNSVLHGVWGTSRDDVWAVGIDSGGSNPENIVMRWDGATWSTMPVEGNLSMVAGWNNRFDDVWIVGEGALHWNSTTWKAAPSQFKTEFSAVWGSGSDDVWAAASDGVHHWNGATWARGN